MLHDPRLKEPVFIANIAILVLVAVAWAFPRSTTTTKADGAQPIHDSASSPLEDSGEQIAGIPATESKSAEALTAVNASLNRLEASLEAQSKDGAPITLEIKSLLEVTKTHLDQLKKQVEVLESSNKSTNILGADEVNQFDEAFRLVSERLDSGDFIASYDLILAASRLGPSDPRLFGLVERFVETAYETEDDEAISLADELLGRGEALIHYQPPAEVESARHRFDKMVYREQLPVPDETIDPFLEVSNLLAVVERTALSPDMRLRAAGVARSALDNTMLERELTINDGDIDNDRQKAKRLQDRLEVVEEQCLTELFKAVSENASGWINDTEGAFTNARAAKEKPPAQIIDIIDSLSLGSKKGYELQQEIAPYVTANIKGAEGLRVRIERQLNKLGRTEVQLHNAATLVLIRSIERRNTDPQREIPGLAKVAEHQLLPYVAHRYNSLWDKLFEELDGPEKQAWALRLRILKDLE